MAAAGIGNPVGAVNITDGGAPRILSGRALSEAISGGVFCFGSTATGVVSSGLNSFVNSDVMFARDASGTQFNGIAIQSVGSNEPIAIATRGTFILVANGTVVCGEGVKCDGNNSVMPLGSTADSLAKGASHKIGRAITSGASGGYCIVEINP